MQIRQHQARAWLDTLNSKDDLRNILCFENEIYDAIQQGLEDPPEFHESIKLLTYVYPYFVKVHSHVETWRPLLLNALLPSQDLRDNDLQIQLYRLMGETALLEGKSDFARHSFQIALKRAEEKQVQEMIVATIAGLLKLQWFDLKDTTCKELIGNAVLMSQEIRELSLRADLHESLAYAFSRLGDTIQGLEQAQMAYIFRLMIGESGEVGRGAATMCMVYLRIVSNLKVQSCIEKANYFLEIAKFNLAQTEYAWQYARLAHEQGHIRHEMQDYEGAKQWFTEALREAKHLGQPQYIVIAFHSLGLAQAELEEFDAARENLTTAYKMWCDLQNIYECASILQALGHLENQAGNPRVAQQHLVSALSLAEKLPEVSQHKYLEKLINDTLSELKE